MVTNAPGTAAPEARRQRGRFNPTENAVQRTRAWTGLLVVVAGDGLIAGAAIFGIWKFGREAGQTVAILSGAFTAIGTMTAAYFGIRAATNTAQSAVVQQVASQQAANQSQQASVVIPTTGDVGPILTGPTDGESAGEGPADGAPPEGDPAGPAPPDGGAPAADDGTGAGEAGADDGDAAAMDRPVDEPDGATQDEQLGLLRDTSNDREDMTEEEEAHMLEGEFGPADEHGVYGAPKGGE
jgi:hypothetical protein